MLSPEDLAQRIRDLLLWGGEERRTDVSSTPRLHGSRDRGRATLRVMDRSRRFSCANVEEEREKANDRQKVYVCTVSKTCLSRATSRRCGSKGNEGERQ